MKGFMRTLAIAGVICGLTLAVAACGSSSSSSTSSSGGSTGSSGTSLKPALDGSGEVLTGGTKGGTLTVLQHEDFIHLDPGEAYFAIDYNVVYATQRPLYLFPPNSPNTAIPDMASGPPIVSSDGKTVTVHIRSGVHFSPPVNREVTSHDVAYAIERGANPNVANPYFPSYFFYIVGADKATGDVLHRRPVASALGSGAEGVRGAAGRQEADGIWRLVGGRHRSVHAEVR
jgi:peptide/nickel transport system substrate-binding protein